MLNFNKSANFLRENVDYINDSLLDINIDSTNDLSALEGAKLIKTNNIELFKVFEIFKRSLMGFTFLKGIFPYFHPKHKDIISYWVDNKCSVELILPEEVSKAVTDFIKCYLPKSNVKNRDIKLITNDINIEFAFIVSDKCLVLAFYHKSGEFNQHAVITSTSDDAIQWGLKLFEEYEKLALEMLAREERGEGFSFYHYTVDLTGGPCIYKRVAGCGVATEYLAVTPTGDLYPCHQFVGDDDMIVGNIYDGITHPETVDIFRKGNNIYTRDDCRDCWARLYCAGGCAANNYHSNGDINKVYRFGCKLHRKRIECALMMAAAREK